MSIKRSKQRSHGSGLRGSDELAPVFAKSPEKEKTWEEAVVGQPEDAFAPYSLKSRYASGALLQHPKFGKGAVVGVEGSHVVVLFADGKKKLGHGVA